jgi:hypothetical protein
MAADWQLSSRVLRNGVLSCGVATGAVGRTGAVLCPSWLKLLAIILNAANGFSGRAL